MKGQLEISQEVLAMIGLERVRHHDVTPRDIRRFAQAIGEGEIESAPDGALIAPPLFCQVFIFEDVPVEELPADGSPKELDIPIPATRAVGGKSEFEMFERVRAGDVITDRSKLKSVVAKNGKSGPLYLIVVETTFENQHGTTVARETATYVKCN